MAKSPESLKNLKPGNKRGPSKTTKALKEAILQAAQEHGEDDKGKDGLTGYLRKVAREDVKAFAGLLGRVLPLQVDANVKHRTVAAAPMSEKEWAEQHASVH